jgi:hypothetical protein
MVVIIPDVPKRPHATKDYNSILLLAVCIIHVNWVNMSPV